MVRQYLSVCLLACTICLAIPTRVDALDGIAPVITAPSGGFSATADIRSGDSTNVHLYVSTLAQDIHWYNQSGNPYRWISLDTVGFSTGISNAGIAVVATTGDGADGAWEYSLDAGMSWQAFGAVTPATARLLAAADAQVRYAALATANTALVPTLTFHAWDGSSGSSGAIADASSPGSPSAFSAESRDLGVTIDGTNDQPTWNSGSDNPVLTGLYSGYASYRSQQVQVSSLLGPASDGDGDSLGIAVTGFDTSAGLWYYSLDGSTWDELDLFDGEGNYDYLLLPGTAWLEFVPFPGGSNTDLGDGLTFQVWDGSDGTPGELGYSGDIDSTALSTTTAGIDLEFTNSTPDIVEFTIDESTSIPEGSVTVAVERSGSVTFWLQAQDDDGDDMVWDYTPMGYAQTRLTVMAAGLGLTDAASYGTVDLVDDGYGQLQIVYTNTDTVATNDHIILFVSDEFGAAQYIDVYIDITANDEPQIVSPLPSTLAVAGQPYQFIVSATDSDAGDTLTISLPGAPAWLSATSIATRRWSVGGTPPASAGSIGYTVQVEDGNGGSATLSPSVEVIGALDVAITVTPPPLSTASSPVYGAIAPGSLSGFQAVNSAYGDLFTDRARALWWQGGYIDLPQLPSAPHRAGLFIATTVVRTLSIPSAPRHPAPFAIPLANGASVAGKWVLIGIPPLALDSGANGSVTTHPWSEFRLEDSDGNPVTDATDILDALETGSEADPDDRIKPYAWDGATYARAASLASGVAYWVPNFSGLDYRLVRTTASDPTRLGNIDLSLAQAARLGLQTARVTYATPRVQRSSPPAPPSGAAAAAAPMADGGGGGGSCGSGGLAGLLIAGLALIGLRPRRRT